jgi:hypothetical protein
LNLKLVLYVLIVAIVGLVFFLLGVHTGVTLFSTVTTTKTCGTIVVNTTQVQFVCQP